MCQQGGRRTSATLESWYRESQGNSVSMDFCVAMRGDNSAQCEPRLRSLLSGTLRAAGDYFFVPRSKRKRSFLASLGMTKSGSSNTFVDRLYR